MDQKIQKDWADVMQQFDLPVDNINTRNKAKGSEICITPKKSSSKASTVMLAFAGTVAVVVAATLYSNKNDSISFESLDSLLSSTTTTSFANASSSRAEPQYLTLTKAFDLSTLETLSAEDTSLDVSILDAKNWKTYVVLPKDKLSKILFKLGINKAESDELKKVANIEKELNKVAASYILRAEKKEGKLNQLITYKNNAKKSFVISRKDGHFTGQFKKKAIETRQTRTTLFIDHSLRYDANQENIPHKIVQKVTKVFDRDVKLTSDLSKGDRMTLVYEQIFHHGNKIADGEILAAELIHDGRSHRAIRFVQADNKVDYFDSKGFDLSNAFKRHPMNSYKRISSGFGKRRHPIYKRIRMHTGVDYAARKGTPVTVTGNGVVHHVARKGGYGKTVIIKHSGGYSTLYGHLSRYKKGLKHGQKVYLGDTIGYVGSTGASTGNHLHFEVRVNGVPKNPLKIKLPKGLSLSASERIKFKENSRNLVRQLDVLQRFAEEKVDIKSGFGG